MAEDIQSSGYVRTGSDVLNTLRLMYLVFLEAREAQEEDARFKAETRHGTHAMRYNTAENKFIASPNGIDDAVDESQLLELQDLAERYDALIEVDGILVNSYIPATFIVDPCGKVTVVLDFAFDHQHAWSVLEREYATIGVMEIIIDE